ncbi:MAG: hypothetical protein IJD59_08830 [Clostridia bacterium]|nr:hypothetical protein [Clostridia bacterium]
MTNKPTIETIRKNRMIITVEYVFRANFNDSYWLEEVNYDFDTLDRENLTWIDPYHGRSKTNGTSFALLYCSDEKFVILKKENGEIRKEEASAFLGYTFCEDYDQSMLLAAHINIS